MKCNENVYMTDQEGIYVVDSNSREAQSIKNNVPKLSHNAKQFIDLHIKLHGVFEKLESGTKMRLDEIVEKECKIRCSTGERHFSGIPARERIFFSG